MRLVLQCSVCGTSQPVGTPACTTCGAEGLQNLRLMFECPACFRLGIEPACGACNPLPLAYEVLDNQAAEAEPVPYEVVEDDEFELTLGGGDDVLPDDDDDFEFAIDLE